MIRIDALLLSVEPLDMRAGPDTCLARVIQVFGEIKQHHAYLVANKRGNGMKVLVHDDFGVWLAARRLHEGKFIWARNWPDDRMVLTQPALIVGLPWQHVGLKQSLSVIWPRLAVDASGKFWHSNAIMKLSDLQQLSAVASSTICMLQAKATLPKTPCTGWHSFMRLKARANPLPRRKGRASDRQKRFRYWMNCAGGY